MQGLKEKNQEMSDLKKKKTILRLWSWKPMFLHAAGNGDVIDREIEAGRKGEYEQNFHT